ncbi:MAG TPA: serine hydrolase [Methylibium sp.]|nr:serine hydrolase [Methylibium sp.]
MHPMRFLALWRRLGLALAAGLALLCGPALAALDTSARTDDHSINVPTGWWTYTGISAAQVGSYLSANSARLTDIEVTGLVSGAPRFAVRMVQNSGAYAISGWWWYYGLTGAQVSSYLSSNSARLIEIEPYDAGGGAIRFAVVMISNTGTQARNWTWLYGATSASISSHVGSTRRLIDIDSYVDGGVKRYTAVTVLNSGSDAKSWQWWVGQSTSSIASRVSSFNGRIVKLDRHSDGSYNFIQVNNTGSNASAWWYYYGFSTLADLNNYANQLASRPIDIVTYLVGGVRRYDGVFIDNANASTRRMRGVFGTTFLDSSGNPTRGIFEAYLKQVGSTLSNGSVRVNLNGARRAETASSLKSLHLLHAMRRVQAGTDTLASAFNYYDYVSGDLETRKNACPNPTLETAGNLRTNYNFETGLDQMMAISDNRTTRGTVIRYGGFAPFNTTASTLGLTSTTLRHNIGCAYRNLAAGTYTPNTLRNDTSAADLARIYEGVWNSAFLTSTNSARTEFLESANPGTGASSALQTIINQEAASLGKSAIAAEFGSRVRTYGKGGSYGTCLPASDGSCGQRVMVRSGTGLIRLPIKVSGLNSYRTYAFARLISDVPISSFGGAQETSYENAYGTAANELYRDEVRSALLTW